MKKLSLVMMIFAFGLHAQAAKVSRDPYDMDQLDISPSQADLYACIDSKIKNAVKYHNSKNSIKLNCKEFLTFN